MKKIITLIVLISIFGFSNAQVVFQSNFANWSSGGLPTDWYGSGSTISTANVSRNFFGASYGTDMAALHNSTAIGTGFSTQNIAVVGGSKYKIDIYVKSNMGEMALGYYDVTNSTYGTIGSYRNVFTSGLTSLHVVDSITIPTTCTSLQLVVYARNTAPSGIGNLGVNLDRVVVTFVSTPPITAPSSYQPLSIYEIQYTTASNGDSPYEDSLVKTTGIVTATHSNGYWIQDSAKAWNGIYVFDNSNSPAKGDKVIIDAEVDEYNNLTELKNVDTLIIVSSGNALPAPIGINTTELSSEEKYEGVLCKVSSATCVNPSAGFGEWDITNTADTGVVDDLIFAYSPIMASVYDVTGVIHYSFGEYKIEPRDSTDIARISSVSIKENEELDFSVFPNPSRDFVTIFGVNQGKAELFSLDGKLVKSTSLFETNVIFIAELKNGAYLLKITSDNKTGVTRFVKH